MGCAFTRAARPQAGKTMKRLIILSIALFSLGCKNGSRNKQIDKVYKDLVEDSIQLRLNLLGLGRSGNQAKWLFYCYTCDEKPKNKCFVDSVTFGQLGSKMIAYFLKHDTIEIHFQFQANDQVKCYDYASIDGVAFSIKSDSLLYVTSHGWHFTLEHLRNLESLNPEKDKEGEKWHRLVDPLHADVIKYIKENEAKLNSWFKSEAVKKGILKK
jgi:hypothetical protein